MEVKRITTNVLWFTAIRMVKERRYCIFATIKLELCAALDNDVYCGGSYSM